MLFLVHDQSTSISLCDFFLYLKLLVLLLLLNLSGVGCDHGLSKAMEVAQC